MILLFLFFYDLREEGRRKESGDEKEHNSAQQKIGTCPGGMHVILSSLRFKSRYYKSMSTGCKGSHITKILAGRVRREERDQNRRMTSRDARLNHALRERKARLQHATSESLGGTCSKWPQPHLIGGEMNFLMCFNSCS